MKSRYLRFLAAVLSLIIMVTTLTGCWDHHELDSIFIVTGIALDKTNNEGKTEITLQIGKTMSKSSAIAEKKENNDSVILLKTENNSITEGITELNRNSNRELFMQHNQVLLLGVPFAEQGIIEQLDMFIRNLETRMEIPVVVVEGSAEEALNVNLKQDKISSIYLSHMLTELAIISPFYDVHLLDFVSQYLDKTVSPVIPVVAVAKQDDTDVINLTGMAVFKADKMIAKLTNDESMGYVWGMGEVKDSEVAVETDEGKAVMKINKLSCKRKATLQPDNSVKAEFSVVSSLSINEMNGFIDISAEEIACCLSTAIENEIKNRIVNCFKISQSLDADIFRLGVMVRNKYTKKWKGIEDAWDDIYRNIELNVDIKVNLTGTGQIMKSIQMEKG